MENSSLWFLQSWRCSRPVDSHVDRNGSWNCNRSDANKVSRCAAICTEWWDSSNFHDIFLKSSESLFNGSSGKSLWLMTRCDSPCLVSWALLECFHLVTVELGEPESPHLRFKTTELEGEQATLGPRSWVCLSTAFNSLRFVLNGIHLRFEHPWIVGKHGTVITMIISLFLAMTGSRSCKYQWHSLDEFQGQRNHFLVRRPHPSKISKPGRPENSFANSAISIFSTFSGGSFDSFHSFGSLLPLWLIEARPGRRRLIPEGSIMRCNLSAKLNLCTYAIWNTHQFEDSFKQTRIPETSRDNTTLKFRNWLWLMK